MMQTQTGGGLSVGSCAASDPYCQSTAYVCLSVCLCVGFVSNFDGKIISQKPSVSNREPIGKCHCLYGASIGDVIDDVM